MKRLEKSDVASYLVDVFKIIDDIGIDWLEKYSVCDKCNCSYRTQVECFHISGCVGS